MSRTRRAALGVAVWAVVGAGLAAPHAWAAAVPDRVATVKELLATRDKAVASGDRNAFLATLDPSASAEFRAGQGRLFDGLRTLPLERYRSELRTDEAPDLSAGLLARYRTDAVFLPEVDVHYRLQGIDTADAIDTFWYTFVLRDGKWRIISDTDIEDLGLQSARNPWDFGAVAHKDSPHFTILYSPTDGPRADALIAIAEDAYGKLVATVGRPAPARVPIILPHTLDQLKEMIQATFDVSNFVAFASAGVDRDNGYTFTAPRVFIQDTNLSKYSRPVQLQYLHHEFVHVTSFALAGPFDASWIHEGSADWISEGKFAPRPVAGSDAILPEDYEFTTGGQSGILRSYSESDSAVAFLAKTKGVNAPMDLLETVGRHRVEAGTERYWVDQGLRSVYGSGLDQFERAWNGGRG